MAKITTQSITKLLEEAGYKKATKTGKEQLTTRSGVAYGTRRTWKGDFMMHRDKNGNISVSYADGSSLASKFGEERNERLNKVLSSANLIVGTNGNIVEKGSKYDPTSSRGIGSTSTSGTGK